MSGTIKLMAEHMGMDNNSNYHRDIRMVLERLRKCALEGVPYDGERNDDPVKRRLGALKIKPGSFEEQLVAVVPSKGVVMVRLGATKEVVLKWERPAFYSAVLAAFPDRDEDGGGRLRFS